MLAVQFVDSKRPFATSRSCRGTSDFRYAPLAAVKVRSAAATTTDTTRSWTKLSRPSANAAGMVSSAANRARSIPTITGRLRRNSTHGPSGTATAAPTASPTAASADTCVGPACSTRIAISGNASNASHVPHVLTAYAAHSHPKFRPSDRLAPMPRTPLAVPPTSMPSAPYGPALTLGVPRSYAPLASSISSRSTSFTRSRPCGSPSAFSAASRRYQPSHVV